jgi:hypothetical protein
LQAIDAVNSSLIVRFFKTFNIVSADNTLIIQGMLFGSVLLVGASIFLPLDKIS